MINPQTGRVIRTKNVQSTRYPWITSEHAKKFATDFGGAIPENTPPPAFDGLFDSRTYGANVLEFNEDNFDDWGPTNAPLYFNPNQTYDQYLFEVMRRDPDRIKANWDAVNKQWYAGQDPYNLVPIDHMYNPITRTFESNFPGMIYNAAVQTFNPAGVFNNALDAVRTVYGTDYVMALDPERQLWEYQHAEYENMNRQIEASLNNLQNTMDAAGMDTLVFMGLIEVTKASLVGSQKLVTRRVFNQLRNLDVLNTAVRDGVPEDQIQAAIDDLLEHPFNSLSLERQEVELPAANGWDQRLADIETNVPPRNAATNEEWQQFLKDTSRTDMVFQPVEAELAAPAYPEMLQEWQLYQMKNRYKTMLRENPELTFEEANIRYMGQHTAREQTWQDIWLDAEDEVLEEEINYMFPEQQEEMKVAEAGGEPPNWQLDAPPREIQPAPRIRSSTDEELLNYLKDESQSRNIEFANDATVEELLDNLVNAPGDVAQFQEMQDTINNYQQMLANETAQAERAMAMDAGELEALMAGELFAGMGAIVPISQAQYPYYTDEQLRAMDDKQWNESQRLTNINRTNKEWRNKAVYVNIGGAWYAGTVDFAMNIAAQDNMVVATVNLDHNGQQVTVPLDPVNIRKQSEFTPDEVATWDFYQRSQPPAEDTPTQEKPKPTDNTTVNVTQPDPPDDSGDWEWDPMALEWFPTHPKQTADGFLSYLNLPEGYTNQTTRTPVNAEKAAIRVGEIDTDGDVKTVMSYMKREHNEVYTTWKNPKYTGYDENRVERIFGNVVPFLAYNSQGHPILMNDTEIDHGGHTDFNMVSTNGKIVAQQDFNNLTPMDATGHFQYENQPAAAPQTTAEKAPIRV